MRKLLTTREAAAKLGHSLTWFRQRREDLFAKGFPRPLLAGGMGRDRYDDAAIDRWLDAQMPAHLQETQIRLDASLPAVQYEQLLEQRLQRRNA